MLNAGTLTFREFMAREKLPLAAIHEAVLKFLRSRNDVVVFGAQAVNAYVKEPRMTQDIDLLSTHAQELALELQEHLRQRFHIAMRIRQIADGQGYRLYQVQKSGNRHLVDVRQVEALPLAERIEKILVMAPAELIARKVIAYYKRRGQPKSGTDWRDLAELLLAFPQFKHESSPVAERLKAAGADQAIFNVWKELVDREIQPADEEEEF